jgi:hypothetical protein
MIAETAVNSLAVQFPVSVTANVCDSEVIGKSVEVPGQLTGVVTGVDAVPGMPIETVKGGVVTPLMVRV